MKKDSGFQWCVRAVMLPAFVVGIAASAMAQSPATLSPNALQQINELLAEKEGRSPAQRKISSALLHAARARKGLPITASVRALPLRVPVRADGRVDVELIGDVSKAVVERIQALGGDVEGGLGSRVARATIPLDRLEEVADMAEVRAIHPALRAATHTMLESKQSALRSRLLGALGSPTQSPTQFQSPKHQRGDSDSGPGTNAGSVMSEGSKAIGADRARNWFAVDGTGVKVGVLSDSDDFKENAIATGDLPSDTFTLPGQSGRPGAGEGTAMMEIVHDVAPGAKLFFATAFNSPESFADNIRALRFTYGCDVIVDDVIYFAESPYEDDIVAQAVRDVTADGAAYFSSAGNEGNVDDGTSGTWEGDFKKSRSVLATLPIGYEVLDFGHNTISNRVTVAGSPLSLHWADPGTIDNPMSSNDYDLFVLDADLRNVLIASTDIQDGNDLAFEFIDATIPVNARVVVARKVGAADRALMVQLVGGTLAVATEGATFGHSAVADAFSVAAVDAAQAGGGEFTGGVTTSVELFSSDGNRRIFYDTNGNLISGSPLFAAGNGEVRRKPDLTAPDGVSTTLPGTSGLNPFFGTSAAAPHAAGVAALIKSGNPGITSAKMRTALTKTSTDIEGLGRDRDSGFGIVNAFNAMGSANVTPRPFLELGTVTFSPTFVLPGNSEAATGTTRQQRRSDRDERDRDGHHPDARHNADQRHVQLGRYRSRFVWHEQYAVHLFRRSIRALRHCGRDEHEHNVHFSSQPENVHVQGADREAGSKHSNHPVHRREGCHSGRQRDRCQRSDHRDERGRDLAVGVLDRWSDVHRSARRDDGRGRP